MSDHRCHLKIEFSIYDESFEWEPDINYHPDNQTGVDPRIIKWFADCYAKARAGYDTYTELRRAEESENRERQQLARLKAKYETDNQVISLRRIQEANPILPQADPPEPPDASASSDDFEHAEDTLGPNWTTAYDREDDPNSLTGPWGRLKRDGRVQWINPTPVGDFSASGITCRVCGHRVEMKAGDVIEGGDPRLCEHLGGPTLPSKGRGFGMKAGETPNEITKFAVDEPKCTCAPGTSRTSCPVHGIDATTHEEKK